MEKREILETYFIGRTDTYMLKDEHGWRRIEDKLTSNILNKHLNQHWIIGSYPIYFKSGDFKAGKARCKWICLDIDFHTEEALKGKDRIEKLIDVIISRSRQFFLCNKKHVIREESERGFHIWIILKKDTLLKKVDKYIEAIRPNLVRLFEDLEIFPKQTLETVLSLGERRQKGFVGNGVKLPWAKGKGKDLVVMEV